MGGDQTEIIRAITKEELSRGEIDVDIGTVKVDKVGEVMTLLNNETTKLGKRYMPYDKSSATYLLRKADSLREGKEREVAKVCKEIKKNIDKYAELSRFKLHSIKPSYQKHLANTGQLVNQVVGKTFWFRVYNTDDIFNKYYNYMITVPSEQLTKVESIYKENFSNFEELNNEYYTSKI